MSRYNQRTLGRRVYPERVLRSALKIAPGAITTSKLAVGSVIEAVVGPAAITNTKIADDAISTPKLQANSIIAGKIAAEAIETNKIKALAVETAKLSAGSVVTDKVTDNAITRLVVALTAGQISVDSTLTVVQSATITRVSNSLLDIHFGFDLVPTNAGGSGEIACDIEIRRGGSVIKTYEDVRIPFTDEGANQKSGFMNIPYVDTDSVSGSLTYDVRLYFYIVSGFFSADVTVQNRYLRLLELKK